MDKNKSIQLSEYISRKIIFEAPKIDYSEYELVKAQNNYSDNRLRKLKNDGLYSGNFETFYVIKRFCDKLDLWKYADEEYIRKLFENAKCMNKLFFYDDLYLKNIKIPTVSRGDILLLNACYEKGEFFQYDMPDFRNDIIVPKLAFFNSNVFFPSIYEGNMPWVSVCPSEINSMKKDIDKAEGRCLVLGLGLGYFPYMISFLDKVKSITIIEINEKIISIFEDYILPQFKYRDKIKIIRSDAIEFLKNVERDEYDFCYADIWEGQADGAPLYLQIKKHEKRLPYTRFAYWIEDEIKWYIDQN